MSKTEWHVLCFIVGQRPAVIYISIKQFKRKKEESPIKIVPSDSEF